MTARGRALKVSHDVLEDRLRHSTTQRPLLRRGLDTLLKERAQTYAAVDGVVDGHGRAQEVAERVIQMSRDWTVVVSRFQEEETRIIVGRGLSKAIPGALNHLEPRRPVLLLLDDGVPEPVRSKLAAELAEHHALHRIDVPGGESAKTWTSLGQILDEALSAGCGRQGAVVAVGGGAVCDLGNLVAHLLGRGAPSILVPTTVLSQVDASVGGKCAVNHAGQRNSIGAFQPPKEVITDLDLLESLDAAEFRSGVAELIKMAILGDTEIFTRLEAGEPVDSDMIARSVSLKARIVARDPTERGERKTLNLGHTLGHALEAASGFQLRHGDAVAMGLVAAARASVRAGYADTETAERIESLLEKQGLPRTPPSELLDAAKNHFAADKKSDAQTIEWIAIRRLGEVTTERLSLKDIQRTLVQREG